MTINQEEIKTGQCEKHGTYPLKKYMGLMGEIKFMGNCPQCEVERKDLECKNRTSARLKSLLEISGIPKRFKNYTFDDYKVDGHENKKRVLEAIKQYTCDFDANKGKGRSMTWIGGPGTGKTMLGCCLVKSIIQKTYLAYEFNEIYREYHLETHDCFSHYRTEYSLIRSIKNTWSKDSSYTEEDKINNFCEPDLLIIDEVGVSFNSDADKLLLYQVINSRYEMNLPSVLISNLNIKDLTAYCGERIVDRMRENEGIQLLFNWESYRR